MLISGGSSLSQHCCESLALGLKNLILATKSQLGTSDLFLLTHTVKQKNSKNRVAKYMRQLIERRHILFRENIVAKR
jgi:hypothetical protein